MYQDENWIEIPRELAKIIYSTGDYWEVHRFCDGQTPDVCYPFPFCHRDMYTFDRYCYLLAPAYPAELRFCVTREYYNYPLSVGKYDANSNLFGPHIKK